MNGEPGKNLRVTGNFRRITFKVEFRDLGLETGGWFGY